MQAKWMKQRRGASLMAYGLVVGLIAVVALSAVTGVGENVDRLFTDVAGNLEGAATGATGPAASPSPQGPQAVSCSPSFTVLRGHIVSLDASSCFTTDNGLSLSVGSISSESNITVTGSDLSNLSVLGLNVSGSDTGSFDLTATDGALTSGVASISGTVFTACPSGTLDGDDTGCIDSGHGGVYGGHEGGSALYMWPTRETPGNQSYAEGVCSGHGGGWYLPNRAELSVLYDGLVDTSFGGADDGVASPEGETVYDFDHTVPNTFAVLVRTNERGSFAFGSGAWVVNMYDGTIGAQNLNNPNGVRCVRR